MKGFILLHRSVLDHWVWLSDKHFKRWIDLIFMASWEDKTIEFAKRNVHIKRGQFITTMRQLKNRWNTNSSTVIEFLHTLRNCKMISYRTRPDMTIITILNYDKYQSEKFWEDSSQDKRHSDENINENPTLIFDPNSSDIENTQAQGQEQTEINKINKQLNSSISFREREEKLFEEFDKVEVFFEETAKNLNIKPDEVRSWREKFKNEMMTLEKWHTDFKDLRQHFYNWLRIQTEKQKQYGTRKQKSGGGESGPQDRYAARRGTDVGSKKASDYGGSF